jgi:hypothetical protein
MPQPLSPPPPKGVAGWAVGTRPQSPGPLHHRRRVRREDRRPQRVGALRVHPQGVFEGVERQHGHDRSERRLTTQRHVRPGLDDDQRPQGAVSPVGEWAFQQPSPTGNGLAHQASRLFPLRRQDKGHRRRGGGHRPQGAKEGAVHRALHENAADGEAGLAAVDGAAEPGGAGRELRVGIAQHEHRIDAG